MQTTFQVKDATKYQQFAVPHVLFCDKDRGIPWAALLRPAGISVYLALRHHANYQSRRARPSEQLLADETGLSARHVRRVILQLISMGMVIKYSAKENVVTNVYTITNPSKWHLPDENSHAMIDDACADKNEGVSTNAPQEMLDLSNHADKSSMPPVLEMSGHLDTHVRTPGHPCPDTWTPMSSKIDPKYIYPSISTATATPTDASCADAAGFVQDAAAVVVENINSVFERKKRFERITMQHVKQICKQHQLTDATEILKAVNVLADDANIKNIIGMLIGKKNAEGRHESSCFEGGVCVFEGGGAANPAAAPPVIDAEPGSLWERVLTTLAGRVNPSSFNTWVRPCRLHAELPDRLKIAVPSETHKFWLELHYKGIMQDVFSATRGGGRGAVEFVVQAVE